MFYNLCKNHIAVSRLLVNYTIYIVSSLSRSITKTREENFKVGRVDFTPVGLSRAEWRPLLSHAIAYFSALKKGSAGPLIPMKSNDLEIAHISFNKS